MAQSGEAALRQAEEVLAKRVAKDTTGLQGEGAGPVPADAVTTSGSGLDPDISPANARRLLDAMERLEAGHGEPHDLIDAD